MYKQLLYTFKIMINTHVKNISSLIHLSTFARFIFPFGNFIAPIVLWSFNKDKSEFIDQNGKAIINFQLSILIYTVALALLSIPLFIFGIFGSIDFLDLSPNFNIGFNQPSTLLYFGGILGVIAFIGFIVELMLIILASLKARDGEVYEYPLTINFIK